MALTREDFVKYQKTTVSYLKSAGLAVTPEEEQRIEIADFGLGEYETTGLGILTYINTDRVCAKELVLLPWQTCPQHLHPPVNGAPGKEETFRCRAGIVYLYVSGERTESPMAKIPEKRQQSYTVWHEVILRPGEQYTIYPQTWHWFQGGPEGAVVSEFSTRSTDELDKFVDPEIERAPVIQE